MPAEPPLAAPQPVQAFRKEHKGPKKKPLTKLERVQKPGSGGGGGGGGVAQGGEAGQG